MPQPNYIQKGETGQSPYFEMNDPYYTEMFVATSEPHQSLKPPAIRDIGAIRSSFSVGMIEISHNRWMSYSTMIICNAILTSILFGYSISVLNSCMNSISLHFEWCGNSWDSSCAKSQFNQAVINAILFLGAVVGSLMSGRLVSLGRRWSLQLACWIFVLGGCVGGVLSFGPYALIQLITGRILVGIGLGIVTVITPLYISEMTPSSTRGFFGTMHQTMIGVGILIGISLGLSLSPNSSNNPNYIMSSFDHWWWRFMLAFQCVPSALCLSGFAFICTDETPHYLIANDQTVEAARTIMHIHSAPNVAEIEGNLLEITQAVYEAKGLTQITLKEAIKEKYYRYGLLVGFFLACIQQLSGINVIISSSDSLFAMAGLTPDIVTLTSTFMALTNALSSAAAALFVENWGRRPLLLWGLLGQVAFMAPVGLLRYFNESKSSWLPTILILSPYQETWLSVIGTFGFVTSFSIALGPIVWIYLSEIYPVEIRGAALGACGAINWLTAFTVVFFGRFMHITTAFNVFGLICLCGLVCTYLWVIETKGSSIEDSPVSPQSMRMSSRLIQNSRGDVQDVTIDEIREKIRGSYSIDKANRSWTSSYRGHICSNHGGDDQITSLGVDPCLLDYDDDDFDEVNLNVQEEFYDASETVLPKSMSNGQMSKILDISSKKSNREPQRKR